MQNKFMCFRLIELNLWWEAQWVEISIIPPSCTLLLNVSSFYVQLTAFKPFFVSLTLPYSVIRGEEFALTITVFNYLTNDMSVSSTQYSWIACVPVSILGWMMAIIIKKQYIQIKP